MVALVVMLALVLLRLVLVLLVPFLVQVWHLVLAVGLCLRLLFLVAVPGAEAAVVQFTCRGVPMTSVRANRC